MGKTQRSLSILKLFILSRALNARKITVLCPHSLPVATRTTGLRLSTTSAACFPPLVICFRDRRSVTATCALRLCGCWPVGDAVQTTQRSAETEQAEIACDPQQLKPDSRPELKAPRLRLTERVPNIDLANRALL